MALDCLVDAGHLFTLARTLVCMLSAGSSPQQTFFQGFQGWNDI